jgi:uncharacterized damage-inducible protein DinB
MNAKEALTLSLSSTRDVLKMYLADLSDADLQKPPTPGANNIAWQLGHLITSEASLMSVLPGATYPELPAALKSHAAKMGAAAPAGGYLTKAEYVDWFTKVRDASIANVDRLSEADFDQRNTNAMAPLAPTLGALIILVANHTLMHGGQFTVVRRALGKPVLF